MPGSFPKSPKEGFRRRAHGIILRMLIREKSSMADSGESALLDFLLPGALLPVWELSAPCIFVPGDFGSSIPWKRTFWIWSCYEHW